MKTVEEKAKAYDEALERAKKLQETCDSTTVVGWCEYIFQELRESKDEKIKKEIINYFAKGKEYLSLCSIGKDDILAWLEKQGEQSSLNINREYLKGIKRVQEYQDLSDWEKEFDKIASMYAHNKNQEGYNDSWYVKERAAEMLYYAKKELEKQGGQKPTDEVESITRSYIIPNEKFFQWIYDRLINVHNENPNVDYMLSLKKRIEDMQNPANDDMKEALQTEYEKGRADAIAEIQKPAWSEEDEKILKDILVDVKFEGYNNDMLANSYKKINWLKSLRQRIGG